MANKDLKNRTWNIPTHILAHLKKSFENFNGSGKTVGYVRMKNLISDGNITYHNLKNVKNIMGKYGDSDIYDLHGGEIFEKWVNSVLGIARNSISRRKKMQKDIGVKNAYKKSHDKNFDNSKPQRLARLDKSMSSNDLKNNNINYESFKRKTIILNEVIYNKLINKK